MARTDYQEEWEVFSEESRPHGLSLREHCRQRGQSYSGFLRWRKKNIDDVTIVELSPSAPSSGEDVPARPQVVYFSVELSNSLRLTQQGIDLPRLRQIVETLGSLC